MAKNIGKSIRRAFQDATDSIKETADDVKDTVKDVNIPDIKVPKVNVPKVKIPDMKEVTKNVKVPDVVEIKSAVRNAVDDVKEIDVKRELNAAAKKIKDVTKVERADSSKDTVLSTTKISCLSTKEALKIFYYLMSADGQITKEEDEKFNEIGNEFSPDFPKIKKQVVEECSKQLEKIIDDADYYDIIQDGIEDALIASMQTINTPITPKLLIWDLLTIAYSDNAYDDIERKLVKYIVRKCGVDKAVFLEMESSILTLMDIEKELTWIKTTNKPYLTIEAMVNELADRKNVIFESVKDLIAL